MQPHTACKTDFLMIHSSELSEAEISPQLSVDILYDQCILRASINDLCKDSK